MKRIPSLVLIVAMLAGCSLFQQQTPLTDQERAIRQVTEAKIAYTVAVTAVNVLHANGKISDSTMKIILPLEATSFDYLQAADAAANAGKTVDAATQLKLFNDALLRFVAVYTPPTTQP